LLFATCVLAGALPLAARWIPDASVRLMISLLIAAVYFGVAFLVRRKISVESYASLAFAFFILALVQVGNDLVPYFSSMALHQSAVAGDPLGSTIFGTISVQLVETFIAVGAVLLITKAIYGNFESIYAGIGRVGWLLVLSLVVFVLMVFITVRHTSSFIPVNAAFSIQKYFSLLPALFVLAISNGFQEEFLFRGLFLKKYEAFFKP